MPGSMMFENKLSIRVLEGLVILVGCNIKGINELDASESKIHCLNYVHCNSKDWY